MVARCAAAIAGVALRRRRQSHCDPYSVGDGRDGYTPSRQPSAHASRIEALHELWVDAGLDAIETREIDVQRTFEDFDDFWTTTLLIPVLRPTFAAMPSKDREILKARVRERLPADATGRITYEARANAVKGRKPSVTSAVGHCGGTSASPPKADIGRTFPEVRLVPNPEVTPSRAELFFCGPRWSSPRPQL